MRLWHEDLINKLPRQQLLGQHRECCALRGNGWNKPHATVNYVFNYNPYKLYQYHVLVMDEMKSRGYKPDMLWENPYYRGKNSESYTVIEKIEKTNPIYPEHDDKYMEECLENLAEKGIIMINSDLYNMDAFLSLDERYKRLVMKSYHVLAIENNISVLESEWAKFKYLVLEHSHKHYLEIREKLKDKDSTKYKEFIVLVCQALNQNPSNNSRINALDHVWGYFKKQASDKEKQEYKIIIQKYLENELKIEEVKRYLFNLSKKYEVSYLLNSYFF